MRICSSWCGGQTARVRSPTLFAGVVEKVVDRLPDATWVYPGHGKDTTLGDERPHLQERADRG